MTGQGVSPAGAVPQAPPVRITDSTLRDGSHAVSHRFTEEQVRSVVHALDAAGMPVIEVSHGDGLGGSSFAYGFSLVDDIKLVAAAADEAARAKIAVLMLPGLSTSADLAMAFDAGASVARIAAHCTEADLSIQHLRAARKLGMDTVGFLTLSHSASPQKLAEQARIMVDAGARCVYVADSANALGQAGVTARVRAVLDEIGSQAHVGFQGRYDPAMGVTSSVLAYQAGARQVDGALFGLGAGDGSSPTELLAATFTWLGIPTGIDVQAARAAAEHIIKPLIRRLPAAAGG
jgi:4-hydroxy 2-oxovalerate aldolase